MPWRAALLLVLVLGRPAAAEVRVFPAAGIRVESAALLLSGQQGGEVPVGLLALPVPGEDGLARVLIRLRMDGPALLAGQSGGVLRVETDFYAVGTGGGIQGSRLETVEIDLADSRESLERSGVELLTALDLRPGSYSLRVLIRNAETGKLAVRALPLTIPETVEMPALPAPGEDRRLTARSPTLGALEPPPFPEDAPTPAAAAQNPAPATPAVDASPEGRRLRKEARAAYRAALTLLAAGREEAHAAAAAFEEALLTRREKPVTVEVLAGIEMEVARELAAADPRSLLPVLLFHQRLYSDATAAGRLVASTLARTVCLGVLEVYRERGTPELAARFARTFGADLLATGVRGSGTRAFQSTLAFEPHDPTTLLYLAVEAEQRRAAAEATAFLNRLLDAQPDHAEARLRLARLSEGPEAEERLRGLLGGRPPRWVLSLAYQELARRLLARRAWWEAEKVLAEGRERLPEDEKLTLLLATRLVPRGAQALLAGYEPEGDDGGGAARHRYNQLPEELLAPTRAELRNEAESRLGALAAALRSLP